MEAAPAIRLPAWRVLPGDGHVQRQDHAGPDGGASDCAIDGVEEGRRGDARVSPVDKHTVINRGLGTTTEGASLPRPRQSEATSVRFDALRPRYGAVRAPRLPSDARVDADAHARDWLDRGAVRQTSAISNSSSVTTPSTDGTPRLACPTPRSTRVSGGPPPAESRTNPTTARRRGARGEYSKWASSKD